MNFIAVVWNNICARARLRACVCVCSFHKHIFYVFDSHFGNCWLIWWVDIYIYFILFCLTYLGNFHISTALNDLIQMRFRRSFDFVAFVSYCYCQHDNTWLEILITQTENVTFYNMSKHTITKTYLYNFDPLKPHFYIVKLGFTGVYIIFLISAQNIDCGYSLEPPRRGGSNEYPQSMFWAEIWKISEFFYLEIFPFWVVKFSIYLNRRVFVMVAYKLEGKEITSATTSRSFYS